MLERTKNNLSALMASPTAGGIILGLAAIAALILSNSPWQSLYQSFITMQGEVRIGGDWLVLAKPAIVWVNDLWMAVFFFLVGLEIKRELLAGELASRDKALLPAVAAVGGMVVPALIYAALNYADPVAIRGWAIPAATDIAFALGVLALLGKRVPLSIKVFLTAVAILDDLGAIVIIALFYTANLSPMMLLGAAGAGALLLLLNRMRVMAVGPYVLIGLLMWLFVLKSGVHATLAGVVTAFAIPLKAHDAEHSPLHHAEHALHPWVAFLILPTFAFANAGVTLGDIKLSDLSNTVTLGIGLGLVLGKTIGILSGVVLAVKLGWARLPQGADWQHMLGTALLCGIGFTMSLFIGTLAYAGLDPSWMTQVKLGVLGGSVIAACLGTAAFVFRRHPALAAVPAR
jgi:Na+:H+ antiporter, NhaA family